MSFRLMIHIIGYSPYEDIVSLEINKFESVSVLDGIKGSLRR